MQTSRAIFLLVLLLSVLFVSCMNSESSGDGGLLTFPNRKVKVKTPIFFSFITDSNGAALKVNSSSLLAARLAFTVNLALYHINQNFSNYLLKYTTALDSEVSL